ncbi:MAG TPA: RsmG family class I SAM-dependent methyltransferase [Thermoanaerobaculaceae bacterium]|nr:RsmG family class I SAM-dependent methyltransferase [Thermoanaerobaculaceae bacterium]
MSRRSFGARPDWAALLEPAGVTGELAARLAVFLDLLTTWGGAVDLVGRLEAADLATDVADSLAALPWLDAAARLLDVGSGNGFPAVPLLLARPALYGVMLEPRERRWAFLKEAVRELGLAAEVRRERLDAHRGAGYDVMTVRGVALGEWQPAVERAVRDDGVVLWWTSEANAAALAAMAGVDRVVHSRLPNPASGHLAVWRRRST